MNLLQQITNDIKEAMKSQNKQKLSVLRMILSDIKYAQAAVSMQHQLSEDQVLKAVSGYHKKLVKAYNEMPSEAKATLESEIKIVEEYLPKKADEAEVQSVIEEILNTCADKNFGNIMKQVMDKLGSSADGKMISQILKQKLS